MLPILVTLGFLAVLSGLFLAARKSRRAEKEFWAGERLAEIEEQMKGIPNEPCGQFACDCSNPTAHLRYHRLSIEADELRRPSP